MKKMKKSKLERILKKAALGAVSFTAGALFGAVMTPLMKGAGLEPIYFIESPKTVLALCAVSIPAAKYISKATWGDTLLIHPSLYAGVAAGQVAVRYFLGK